MRATVRLERAGAPRELQVKLRLPADMKIGAVTVNGEPSTLGGTHGDAVVIRTGERKEFEVVRPHELPVAHASAFSL